MKHRTKKSEALLQPSAGTKREFLMETTDCSMEARRRAFCGSQGPPREVVSVYKLAPYEDCSSSDPFGWTGGWISKSPQASRRFFSVNFGRVNGDIRKLEELARFPLAFVFSFIFSELLLLRPLLLGVADFFRTTTTGGLNFTSSGGKICSSAEEDVSC